MGGGGTCDFSVTPSPNWTWILDWFGIGSRTTGLGLDNSGVLLIVLASCYMFLGFMCPSVHN